MILERPIVGMLQTDCYLPGKDPVRSTLFRLPDETIIYPGHGPGTTVGREKMHNPFFFAGIRMNAYTPTMRDCFRNIRDKEEGGCGNSEERQNKILDNGSVHLSRNCLRLRPIERAAPAPGQPVSAGACRWTWTDLRPPCQSYSCFPYLTRSQISRFQRYPHSS